MTDFVRGDWPGGLAGVGTVTFVGFLLYAGNRNFLCGTRKPPSSKSGQYGLNSSVHFIDAKPIAPERNLPPLMIDQGVYRSDNLTLLKLPLNPLLLP